MTTDDAALLPAEGNNDVLQSLKHVDLKQLSAPPGVSIGPVQLSQRQAMIAGTLFVLGAGVVLGFVWPSKLGGGASRTMEYASGIIGWVYFMAWSVSFYPQFYLNYVRKSVIGMSFDYQMMNLVGFTAYSIFNLAFYYNDSIQEAYRAAHGGHSNVVQANDVFFAVHALFWTVMTFGQIFLYERGGQKHSPIILGVSLVSTVLFVAYAIALAAGASGSIFTWLDFVVGVSYVKLGVTLIKYFPQAYLNYSRRCTIGWSIVNVLLDFTGGTLSVVQQLMDCAATGNWQGISGDPVKFALGFTSMVFDIVFMLQHYVFFAENNCAIEAAAQRTPAAGVASPAGEEEGTRLLSADATASSVNHSDEA